MKRHESIIPLSRDHHSGLLCCWKIRQGIKNNISPERILSYIQYFWNYHLKEHFEEEEKLLFVTIQNELIERAINEHRELKVYIDSLRPAAPPDKFLQFVQLLDDHIRFEERVLFPYIEKTLPEEQLVFIGRQLHEIHSVVKTDNYEDEFWIAGKIQPG